MTSMSPRKAAAAKAAPAKAAMTKPAVTKPAAPKPVALKAVAGKAAKPAEKSAETAGDASADATRLAAEIERALQAGKLDTLTPEAFQALMAALCKSYGAQREAGVEFLPVADRMSASPTEIMMIASGLLRAANLAVFELGMWQSWTGR
jgi:hypothetical protein